MKSQVDQMIDAQQSNEIERLSGSLGFLVNGLARLMRTELESRLKEHGLTPTTWTVLIALLEEDSLSQTDLARRTFLDGATMTRALDLLEAKGFISRIRDGGDRRVQIVVLSNAGRTTATLAARHGMEINAEVTTGLNEKERAKILKFLSSASRRLTEKTGEAATNGS